VGSLVVVSPLEKIFDFRNECSIIEKIFAKEVIPRCTAQCSLFAENPEARVF